MVGSDDKVYCSAATPEFRQYLEWLSAAYRDGLVDKEFLTHTTTITSVLVDR